MMIKWLLSAGLALALSAPRLALLNHSVHYNGTRLCRFKPWMQKGQP
jgi:hypothetical protein